MLQAVETALPLGGDLQVQQDGDSWLVRAEGPRIIVDQPLWDSVTSPNPAFHHTAAQVQFALLPSVLAAVGRRLELIRHNDRLVIRF